MVKFIILLLEVRTMIQVSNNNNVWFLTRFCVDGPAEEVQAFKLAMKARQAYRPPAGGCDSVSTVRSFQALCELFRPVEESDEYVMYDLENVDPTPRKLFTALAKQWPALTLIMSLYRVVGGRVLRHSAVMQEGR